jgi:hydroxymethylbilane synthase
MSFQTLRIATRKSPLALWQANYVGQTIQTIWPTIQIELIPLVTSGDKFQKDKLLMVGGKGLFVKELEEALLDNRADLAVHSMKDMPVDLPLGLSLTTICKRHSPWDALVSQSHAQLERLPKGAIIGTSSLRRESQLRAYRPDLRIKTLRGNINTRLDQLRQGQYDAIILAAAGLERLGMEETISELLPEEIMLPACGQGALGIECRTEDTQLHALLAPLNDELTAMCVHSERVVNAKLGGNCHVPLAVFCSLQADGQLALRAKVLSLDGQTIIQTSQSGSLSQALVLAANCATTLLNSGAEDLLAQTYL